MKKSRLLGSSCTAFIMSILITTTHNVYATSVPALSITGANVASDSLNSNTFGYDFTANGDYFVTALGIYDDFGDGLNTNYEVGIWNASQVLLGSITVPTGSTGTLIDGFRYQNLTTNITLNNGDSYRIGALVPKNHELVNGVSSITSTSITVGATHYFTGGGTLSYPSTVSSGKAYITSNMLISAVPIPGAIWLFGSGLLGLIGVARRKKAA